MRSYPCINHPAKSNTLTHPFTALDRTAATWIDVEHKNYLSNVNYKLINEITDCQTQKHFYKTKLSQQFRAHQDQLQEAFALINEKNGVLIGLQEQYDRSRKEIRGLADDLVAEKRNRQAEKQYFDQQMQRMKTVCEQKIKKIQEECDVKYQLKLRKRVQEVQNQCADRIKLYTSQISQLTQNSKQLSHELSLLQEDYRQMLLKNDTIIQESIHRQLRKRDFEAQNNYLRDLAQYQHVKKDRQQLRQQINQMKDQIESLEKDNKRLNARLEVEKTRMKDLQGALAAEKANRKEQLFQTHKYTNQVQTNTDQQFVPIAMPVDVNLAKEVVSFKEFLVEKIIERFIDFFTKATGNESKKTSKSLITFKNCLEQLKQRNPELKILLFLHTSLQKIIKLYCPSLAFYSKDFLTVKDDFVKKTLMECETISNNPQKLFRLLDLIFRIKNPLNHLHSDISIGQLRLVQIKLLGSLKKNFI